MYTGFHLDRKFKYSLRFQIDVKKVKKMKKMKKKKCENFSVVIMFLCKSSNYFCNVYLCTVGLGVD